MLVLSRKKSEKIRINDDITISVIEIRGNKVRIGIDAPRDITVHRGEFFDLMESTGLKDDCIDPAATAGALAAV